MTERNIKYYQEKLNYFQQALEDPGCTGFWPMCRKAIGYCEKRIWQLLTLN